MQRCCDSYTKKSTVRAPALAHPNFQLKRLGYPSFLLLVQSSTNHYLLYRAGICLHSVSSCCSILISFQNQLASRRKEIEFWICWHAAVRVQSVLIVCNNWPTIRTQSEPPSPSKKSKRRWVMSTHLLLPLLMCVIPALTRESLLRLTQLKIFKRHHHWLCPLLSSPCLFSFSLVL